MLYTENIKMQITPLFLFLLLVFLLLFVVVFRWTCEKEGFISYNYSGRTDFSSAVSIPQYDSTAMVYKVYDGFYFDPRNGNLIELTGDIYSATSSGVSSGMSSGTPPVSSGTSSGTPPVSSGTSSGTPPVSSGTPPVSSGTPPVSSGASSGMSSGMDNLNREQWRGGREREGERGERGERGAEGFEASGSGYGSGIKSINIYAREDGRNTTIIGNVIPRTNQLHYWYRFSDGNSMNPTSTVVYYFALDNDTYLHTMSKDTASRTQEYTNLSTTRIIGNNTSISQQTRYAIQKITTRTITEPLQNDGTFKTIQPYPNRLYMITSRVGFDISTGNILINNANTGATLLNRSGNIASQSDLAHTSVPTNSDFRPFIAYIDGNGSWLLYMQGQSGTTMVVIFNSNMTVFNVVCFTNNSVWNHSTAINNELVDSTSGAAGYGYGSGSGRAGYGVSQGTYEYWLAYWNSMSDSQNPTYSEDYLLKTQVVPPVCPTCPSCSTTGTCTNCGGTGGAGILGTLGTAGTGEGVSGVINNTVNTAGDIVNRATLAGTVLAGGAGLGAYNLASKTLDMTGSGVSGAVGLARDTVGGTVGLARDTVGGTVGLARDTVGGTVGLARETVGGAVGLARDTVGGAVGLLKSAGTGVKDVLTQGPSQSQYGNQSQYGGQSVSNQSVSNQSTGTQVGGYQSQYSGNQDASSQIGVSARYNTAPGADPYSYYGALPSKGQSNYIPITADFSAFSK